MVIVGVRWKEDEVLRCRKVAAAEVFELEFGFAVLLGERVLKNRRVIRAAQSKR